MQIEEGEYIMVGFRIEKTLNPKTFKYTKGVN